MKLFSFQKKYREKDPPAWLIVGLGNPGEKYATTRHNAGFLALDALAQECGISLNQLKFNGLFGTGKVGGVSCLLLKPQTFMNSSGDSVAPFAKAYQIPPERTIVLMDEISLPPGKLRIRSKGSHGGHNGAKSVTQRLASEDWKRIKIGVGQKPHPDYDLAAWVLAVPPAEDLTALRSAAQNAAKAVVLIVQGKQSDAMNQFNS